MDQGNSFFNKKTKYKLLRLGGKVIDQTTGKYSARVEREVADLIFISGSPKQSKLKIGNEKVNLKNFQEINHKQGYEFKTLVNYDN